MRAEALGKLEFAWATLQELPLQHETRLHYLAGKIEVELVLPLESFVDPTSTAALQAELKTAAEDLPWLGRLRVLYG